MKKLSAYSIYLFMEGASALFFTTIVTVNLFYQATVAGLNPLQLVLVGTVLETTVFLFEVPTGIVADVYSRRVSIIIGFCLAGLGFMLEGSIPFFGTILLAQVVWGIGYTFTSGAIEAWLADEIGEENAGLAYLRGAQVAQLASLIGTAISVALASVNIQLPIIMGGASFLALSVFLILFMPERGFRPTPSAQRSTWQRMQQTLRDGVRMVQRRPLLMTILSIGGIYGMFSEGLDRLWTPHLLDDIHLPTFGQWPPVIWFGIIAGVTRLLSVAATEMVRRRVDTNSHWAVARALLIINAGLMSGVMVLALAWNFALAVASFWIISSLRRIDAPLQMAWINQRLDPRVRATVISMRSQADALGQIAGGPVLGAIATGVSIRAALALAAIILSPALLLYARTLRREHDLA